LASVGFFGSALSGLGGSAIGSAVVTLYLADQQYSAQLAKARGQTEAAATTMGQRVKALGPAFAVAGAAAAIGIGVQAVKAFNESEAAIAQTNAVLKSTGGIAGVTGQQVTNLATRMQDLTTFSDEEVRSAENLLLTFTRISSDIFPQTTEAVLDVATALGKDLNSSAIMVGKALNDPILGLTALGRAGVQFTEQQKEQIKVLVESNRTLEAQKIILGELNTQMGGSARAAATTFAGQMKQLGNELNDVLEELGRFIVAIGRALIPAIKALVPVLGLAARNAGLLMAAFAAYATIKWVIPFLDNLAIKFLHVAGASLSAQIAVSKWMATLAAFAGGPVTLAIAALGGIVIVASQLPPFLEVARQRLEALGLTAQQAEARLHPFEDQLNRVGPAAGGVGVAINRMTEAERRNQEIAEGWASRQAFVASQMEETREKAHDLTVGLRRLARASDVSSKEFKENVLESSNFVEAAWEDLVAESRVTAREIIRSFRRALRDQAEFASNTRTFARNVREAYGGEIPAAAKQMIADLAQRGVEGATIMAGLADANQRQIRRITSQWKEGERGPEQYIGVLEKVLNKIDTIDGRNVVIDITARYHQIGQPPPGLDGFDRAVEEAIDSSFIRGQSG
jgi:hypothetical protein